MRKAMTPSGELEKEEEEEEEEEKKKKRRRKKRRRKKRRRKKRERGGGCSKETRFRAKREGGKSLGESSSPVREISFLEDGGGEERRRRKIPGRLKSGNRRRGRRDWDKVRKIEVTTCSWGRKKERGGGEEEGADGRTGDVVDLVGGWVKKREEERFKKNSTG